jgi:hypothetical protein
MKKIKYIILTLGVIAGFGLATVPSVVGASTVFDSACKTGSSNVLCDNKTDNVQSTIGVIVNVLLYLLGAISVLMIILGGISYTTSAGDPAKITKAKNTIMYSVVGLVVALLSVAIINFVLIYIK